MNRKQLGILLAMVVVIGGAGLVVFRNQQGSWSSAGSGGKLFGNLPVNDVTQLAIKQGTNSVTLVKRDEMWRVQEREGYPANYAQISDFLLKIRDLKAVRTEKVGPSQLPRLQLAAPGDGTNSAVLVEFKGANDKILNTLLLGKLHMSRGGPSQFGDGESAWPDGRYIKSGIGSDEVALISDPLQTVQPEPETWLNKDFIRVEKAKSVAVEFPEATNSWKLTRETETGDWQLADAGEGEQVDSAKTSALYSPLSAPSFQDVAGRAPAEIESATTLWIETFDGVRYQLTMGRKTNENYPVILAMAAELAKERAAGADETPEDKERLDKEFQEQQKTLEEKIEKEKRFEGWVYLMPGWSLDSILKPRAELLAAPAEEAASDDHAGHNHGILPGPDHPSEVPMFDGE